MAEIPRAASQYQRTAEAPVPVNQYRAMLSSCWATLTLPPASGRVSEKATSASLGLERVLSRLVEPEAVSSVMRHSPVCRT
ncbi:hypothetical protein GCM10023195_55680 [Actinoallomurus liliacearum]|uniref:DUF5753 domain-containing protein n=1 Tax=Actinoallomurus liliacearum TaxID=1080073 RepID=A0ABP8TS82_9ACTN